MNANITVALPKRVIISDVTIREGEETTGVVPRLYEADLIAQKPDETRIFQIQMGRCAKGVIKNSKLGIKTKMEALAGVTDENH